MCLVHKGTLSEDTEMQGLGNKIRAEVTTAEVISLQSKCRFLLFTLQIKARCREVFVVYCPAGMGVYCFLHIHLAPCVGCVFHLATAIYKCPFHKRERKCL